jgi:anaerobic nitric oxide reductase transcription regulator
VDVRLIAATNRDLAEEVKRGHFAPISITGCRCFPSGCRHCASVGATLLLAGYFLEENRARLGLTSLRLSADAQRALLDYPWPGNIRELEHLVGRSALRALAAHKTRPGILTLDAAALELHAPETAAQPGAAVPEQGGQAQALSLREQCSYERRLVDQSLQRHDGNFAATARELGLDRANLNRLARRLGLR